MGISKSGGGRKVGEIFDHSGTVAPPGAMALPTALTNVSRTAYAKLFLTIGTVWGNGDGATTFGLPWCAADQTLVQSNGNVGTQTIGENLTHSHAGAIIKTSDFGYAGGGSVYAIGNGGSVGTQGSSANLPAGARVLKCIQYL